MKKSSPYQRVTLRQEDKKQSIHNLSQKFKDAFNMMNNTFTIQQRTQTDRKLSSDQKRSPIPDRPHQKTQCHTQTKQRPPTLNLRHSTISSNSSLLINTHKTVDHSRKTTLLNPEQNSHFLTSTTIKPNHYNTIIHQYKNQQQHKSQSQQAVRHLQQQPFTDNHMNNSLMMIPLPVVPAPSRLTTITQQQQNQNKGDSNHYKKSAINKFQSNAQSLTSQSTHFNKHNYNNLSSIGQDLQSSQRIKTKGKNKGVVKRLSNTKNQVYQSMAVKNVMSQLNSSTTTGAIRKNVGVDQTKSSIQSFSGQKYERSENQKLWTKNEIPKQIKTSLSHNTSQTRLAKFLNSHFSGNKQTKQQSLVQQESSLLMCGKEPFKDISNISIHQKQDGSQAHTSEVAGVKGVNQANQGQNNNIKMKLSQMQGQKIRKEKGQQKERVGKVIHTSFENIMQQGVTKGQKSPQSPQQKKVVIKNSIPSSLQIKKPFQKEGEQTFPTTNAKDNQYESTVNSVEQIEVVQIKVKYIDDLSDVITGDNTQATNNQSSQTRINQDITQTTTKDQDSYFNQNITFGNSASAASKHEKLQRQLKSQPKKDLFTIKLIPTEPLIIDPPTYHSNHYQSVFPQHQVGQIETASFPNTQTMTVTSLSNPETMTNTTTTAMISPIYQKKVVFQGKVQENKIGQQQKISPTMDRIFQSQQDGEKSQGGGKNQSKMFCNYQSMTNQLKSNNVGGQNYEKQSQNVSQVYSQNSISQIKPYVNMNKTVGTQLELIKPIVQQQNENMGLYISPDSSQSHSKSDILFQSSYKTPFSNTSSTQNQINDQTPTYIVNNPVQSFPVQMVPQQNDISHSPSTLKNNPSQHLQYMSSFLLNSDDHTQTYNDNSNEQLLLAMKQNSVLPYTNYYQQDHFFCQQQMMPQQISQQQNLFNFQDHFSSGDYGMTPKKKDESIAQQHQPLRRPVSIQQPDTLSVIQEEKETSNQEDYSQFSSSAAKQMHKQQNSLSTQKQVLVRQHASYQVMQNVPSQQSIQQFENQKNQQLSQFQQNQQQPGQMTRSVLIPNNTSTACCGVGSNSQQTQLYSQIPTCTGFSCSPQFSSPQQQNLILVNPSQQKQQQQSQYFQSQQSGNKISEFRHS